jgi:hypothetical protein
MRQDTRCARQIILAEPPSPYRPGVGIVLIRATISTLLGLSAAETEMNRASAAAQKHE